MHFQRHWAFHSFIGIEHVLYRLMVVFGFAISQKSFDNINILFRLAGNDESLMTLWISGPVKTPASSLASVNFPLYFFFRYWKLLPWSFMPLTKFFFRSSLMWSDGRRTFWGSISAGCFTLYFQQRVQF